MSKPLVDFNLVSLKHPYCRKALGVMVAASAILGAGILCISGDEPTRIQCTNDYHGEISLVAKPSSDPDAPKVVSEYENLIFRVLSKKIRNMSMEELQSLPSNETFLVEQTQTGTFIRCYPLQYDVPDYAMRREPYHLSFFVSEKNGELVLSRDLKERKLEALLSRQPSSKLPGGIVVPF